MVKSFISSLIPMRLRKAIVSLRRPTAQLVNPQFSGWGMASLQKPPSAFLDRDGKAFADCHQLILELVKSKDIMLSQFGAIRNQLDWLNALQWRHYFVQASVSRFIRSAHSLGEQNLEFSEFGVCDGLTAFFALHAMRNLRSSATFNLYDSWSEMRSDDLLDSELLRVGNYSYLSLDNTKRNLRDFSDSCNFIKGYLPETLPAKIEKYKLRWIHIDINNARLTTLILDRLFEASVSGSICLLDDYGHLGFEDTRKEVDQWIEHRSQDLYSLEVLPTGQAVIYKH